MNKNKHRKKNAENMGKKANGTDHYKDEEIF